MTITSILEHFYNKPKEKKREIGKYWASDIYAIRKGYLTPGTFFKQKPIDEQGGLNIFWGSAAEHQLDLILSEEHADYTTQQRLELTCSFPDGKFTVSGKTDFSFPNFILETKCPKDATYSIPEKWKDQLEFYHRASKKAVKLGIFYKNGKDIIKFFSYDPDEKRWAEIQLMLENFHHKLVKKHGNN